jgi:hypothetical protein
MFDVDVVRRELARDVSGWSAPELTTGLRALAVMRCALEAAEARVLARVAETNAHVIDGATDPARWLRDQTGISAREAARRTALAGGLTTLGDTAGALARGILTPEHARLLAGAVARTPELASREANLVETGASVGVDEFARHVRRLELLAQSDQGAGAFERQRTRRQLTITNAPGGGWRLGGFVDDVDGRIVDHALEMVAEDLWRTDHPDTPTGARDATLPQRRADALVEICRRALLVTGTESMTRQAVPLVMVLIDHDTLTGRLTDTGVCELDDGTPLSPQTARRLACTADILPVVLDGSSQPLDLARVKRLASVAQRRAMIMRSGGRCETPGCHAPWWRCDAHHLGPGGWEGGAPTNLEHLALVCNHHHHLLHEGGAQLTRHPDGSFALHHPDGTTHTEPTRRRGLPRPRPTTHHPTAHEPDPTPARRHPEDPGPTLFQEAG